MLVRYIRVGDEDPKELGKLVQLYEKEAEAARREAMKHGGKRLSFSFFEDKVPDKALETLKTAFSKGFKLVLKHGGGTIEKCLNSDEILKERMAREVEIELKKNKKAVKKLRADVKERYYKSLTAVTAEGAALGFFGIGLPDVAVFTGLLLRSSYESALSFGRDYTSEREKYIILLMMEGALKAGSERIIINKELDRLLLDDNAECRASLDAQCEKTAAAFADELTTMRFIQGFPILGILGGVANNFTFRRVMTFVNAKYRYAYAKRRGEEVKEGEHENGIVGEMGDTVVCHYGNSGLYGGDFRK